MESPPMTTPERATEAAHHGVTDIIDSRASASVSRSLAKTVSWRVVGSIDTAVLGYLLTGSLAIAGSIASAEVLTKLVLYYLHERAWAHVRWGRQKT
jgi:uncharacterized membrane protein